MKRDINIKLWLDKRRILNNGQYPVRLRVFVNNMQKLYSTTFSFTKEEYKDIYDMSNKSKKISKQRRELFAFEEQANIIAKELSYFSFPEYEKELFDDSRGVEQDVVFYYKKKISSLKNNRQLGTAETYTYSLNSFISFHKHDSIPFYSVNVEWLNSYKHYMFDRGRSTTTVSIYIRTLRAIFNEAISNKIINKEAYPFGKGKFQIPEAKNVKKAISQEDFKTFFYGEPHNEWQQKAKDFWLFLFFCNGTNVKDIAYLKYKNISFTDKVIAFRREKVRNIAKISTPITVFFDDKNHIESVIQKYGNPDKNPNNYVFSIIDSSEPLEKQREQYRNFNRFILQHIKTYAKHIGYSAPISVMTARHTFATLFIRSGGSIGMVSKLVGHSSIKTTENYFGGFEDSEIKKITKLLSDF